MTLTGLLARLRAIFRPGPADARLDDEMRFHLDMQTEHNMSLGMGPAEARRQALVAFGGVERHKEAVRDARGVALIDNLLRDLRYMLRGLYREPMLLLAATASIGLGAASNIAVFSLARELMLAPPDAREPDGLVEGEVSHGSHVSYRRWADLNASGALADIAGFSIERQVNWFDGETAVSITPLLVTANFFDVVGPPLERGRGFSTDEARAEANPHLAVVSHGFWQRELHGDPGVIGRLLTFNGEPYTVLGVLPEGHRSVAGQGISPPVYLALNRSLVPGLETTTGPVVKFIARLKPEQSFGEARAALDAADRRLGRAAGDTVYAGVQVLTGVSGFRDTRMGRTLGAFFGLLALVSLAVLLIACANVAGLLIARGNARRREIAIRLAIGGTRARLLQQFLVEGFLLALIGTAAGLGLTLLFMRVMNGLTLPVHIPVALHLTPDLSVMGYAVGLVILCTLLCSLFPALQATRASLTPALKLDEPRYGRGRLTLRRLLLAGQVMVSTVLLVTAALFLRNLAQSQVIEPGFDVERSLVAEIGFSQDSSAAGQALALERFAERVGGLPGVERASYATGIPLTTQSGSHSGNDAWIDGSGPIHVEWAQVEVGPGYFATMGIPLLDGREFLREDRQRSPPVMIINAEFARRYVGAGSAIGHRIRIGSEEGAVEYEVVGMAADGKYLTIGEEPRGAIYFPLLQRPEQAGVAFVLGRTRGDPAELLTPVRKAIGDMDRTVAVTVSSMRSATAFALLPSRIGAAVLGTLGALGLILATFGLYSIVAYNVSRTRAEIAIRMALGATRAGIVRLVIRDAATVVGIGLLIGLALAALVTRPLAIYLVAGMSATDPSSFIGTALAFLTVTVLAAWLPARQATRVNPAMAMRAG